MNNKEAELVLECMAVDMTGALCDTKEPMRDVLQQRIEAINIAQKALRQNDAESGEPLTLEQLIGMDGKPAYWSEDESWGIISVEKTGRLAGTPFFRGRKNGANFEYDIESRGMKVYAYPPAHIDREAWKPCSSCKSCDSCKFSFFSVESDGPCFGCENYENYEPQSYCPECGRPLTDEAWDELEKRISGE